MCGQQLVLATTFPERPGLLLAYGSLRDTSSKMVLYASALFTGQGKSPWKFNRGFCRVFHKSEKSETHALAHMGTHHDTIYCFPLNEYSCRDLVRAHETPTSPHQTAGISYRNSGPGTRNSAHT